MTIRLFSGPPGAGKTMHATEVGLMAQRRPGGVIANYEITRPKVDKEGRVRWRYVAEDAMTPQLLMEHSTRYTKPGRESQVLLIVDEAHRILNVRSGWNEGREGQARRNALLRFLSEHRHFGYDVILIAQSDLMIDKQSRFLIEKRVKHFKWNQFWWFSWCPVPVFGQVSYDYQFPNMKGQLAISMLPPARGRYDFQAMRKRAMVGQETGRAGVLAPAPAVLGSVEVADANAARLADHVSEVSGGAGLVPEGAAAVGVGADRLIGPLKLLGPILERVNENSDLVVAEVDNSHVSRLRFARTVHEWRRFGGGGRSGA